MSSGLQNRQQHHHKFKRFPSNLSINLSNYSPKKAGLAAYALALLTTFSSSANASGFLIMEQNVTNLGTAYAGTAALAEDATTGFYNCAGLTRLGEEQIAISGVGIIPYARLNATRATATVGATPIPTATAPVFFQPNATPLNIGPGSTRTNAFALVPGVHYALRLDDCVVFGLNVTSPFGLKTKYKYNSIARYMGTRGEIRTYDITPSLAFDFCNGVSFGIGLDILHTLARLDNRTGFGVVERDGLFENTVSRWTLGGHAGFLFEFSDIARFGVHYRSGFKVKGHGQSRTELPVFGLIQTPPTIVTQGVRADVRLPGTFVFSAYADNGDCWALMADIQYTNWSKFRRIRARFDDGNVLVQRFDFKDTWRYALGTSYRFSECFLGRIGAAYDISPVRSSIKRTTLIPDSDRTWLALGAQYRITDCLTMEAGYAHLWFKKARIQQGPPTINGRAITLQSINTRVKARADLVGLQFTWDIA